MTVHLPLGVRLVDRVMRLHPMFDIVRMDADRLTRMQQAVLPDGGLASLVLGRLQKGVEVTTTSYAAPHGEVPLRVYRPTSAPEGCPLVVAFHGGGFALGSARQGDWASSVVARELGAVVVSVDYRLAPTHPFPAAVEDCYGALAWAAAEAESLGVDPGRIGVMGESAGGNLAAVVAILARDRGGPRLAHQALLYPVTDMTEAVSETESFRTNAHGIVVSHEGLEVFRGHYLGPSVDPRDPRLSPVHAESLAGLPPAVIVVAGLDPLHDSGVAYAEALVAAGGQARVEDFHRMPHGFLGFPYLACDARPAIAAVVASQRAALAGGRRLSSLVE
jgi:acetyl esterase